MGVGVGEGQASSGSELDAGVELGSGVEFGPRRLEAARRRDRAFMIALPVYLEHHVMLLPYVRVIIEGRSCGQLGDVVVDGVLEQQQLLEAHLLKKGVRLWGSGALGIGLHLIQAHLAVGIGVKHAEELGHLLLSVAHAQRVQHALELIDRDLARPLAPVRDQLEEARHIIRKYVEDLRRHVDLVVRHVFLFVFANPTNRDAMALLLNTVPPTARLDAKPMAAE